MKNAQNTVNILGVPFERMTEEEARRKISEMLSVRGNARIFTPNAEILCKASDDSRLLSLLRSADLLLPDGIGTVLASRLGKAPLPCRITGIDTAEYILSVAAERGLSVYLLGGRAGVAQKAATELNKRYPALRICGVHHGYFDRSGKESENVLAEISAARPDILFVCLGFPAQEEFIAENTRRLPFLRLSMGLGGSLDVWSGETRRAPLPLRKMGLEWLVRSFGDIRRTARLKYLARFAWKVVRRYSTT